MKTQIALGVFTALSASMCCITPVLAIAAGTSSLATSFHWLEPFRPYFIFGSIITLGFAWFQALNVKKDENCCEPQWRKSFFQSKVFLSIITIFSLLLITFPSYSKFLFPNSTSLIAQEQNKDEKIELKVSGMTCASCELHIESEVKKLPGVSFVKASYEKGSTTVEFDKQKIKADKIIEAINGTGYKVEQTANKISLTNQAGNCCAKGTCKDHLSTLPKGTNMSLKIASNVSQIQKVFNQQNGKTKFVAILSSTCGWCLQGAESIQKTVIEKSKNKNISVIIIWTNMLKTDDQTSAYKAASLFNEPNVTQFFDSENKFGDIVAQRLSPQGKKAWDIYMFFDKETQWGNDFPRPFEYVHQLSSSVNPWIDQTKYFCGPELTRKLEDIVITL
jgi:mercuric ion transport protein